MRGPSRKRRRATPLRGGICSAKRAPKFNVFRANRKFDRISAICGEDHGGSHTARKSTSLLLPAFMTAWKMISRHASRSEDRSSAQLPARPGDAYHAPVEQWSELLREAR